MQPRSQQPTRANDPRVQLLNGYAKKGIYTYEPLSSPGKEGESDTRYSTAVPVGHCTTPLTALNAGFQSSGGGGWCSMGTGFRFCKMLISGDGGDGYTMTQTCSMPLHYSYKTLRW